MRHTWIRYIAIALLAVTLLGLCACADQFANFNDGMTDGVKRGYYEGEYDYERVERMETLRETIAWIAKLVLIAAVGIVGIAAPKALWWVVIGWQIKDAEPSDAALVIYRIIGAILLIVSAVLALKSF